MKAQRKTAVFIKRLDGGWVGDVRLFRLEPPLGEYEYVAVSGGNGETIIVPSDENGEWEGEMTVLAFVGTVDHSKALKGVGYDIAYR